VVGCNYSGKAHLGVVIDDFHVRGFIVGPVEADSILIVDRGTPLTVAIAGELM